MKKLFTLLVFIITFVSFSQESVLLRVKYNEGDQYLMKMNMTQNMGEGAMLMDMDMHMKIDVKGVKDTVYDTEMSFTRIAMKMNQAGKEIIYDSNLKDEELDDMGKQMKIGMGPLLEMVISAKTTHLGEVIDMQILEGVGDINQFKQSNNNVVYPVEPVKVGSSWSDEKNNNGMTMKYTYTVKSIEKGVVKLDVTGDITGAAQGTFKGDMQVNKSNGLPEEATIDMDMSLSGQDVKTTVSFTFDKI